MFLAFPKPRSVIPAFAELLWRFVVEPEQVIIRVDDITRSSSTLSASASAVKICWNAPRTGDVAKYELNIASAAPADVERRQIWIDVADTKRRDGVTGRLHCRQLDTARLSRGQLHHVLLRPWTADRRPGLSVVALFNLSGLQHRLFSSQVATLRLLTLCSRIVSISGCLSIYLSLSSLAYSSWATSCLQSNAGFLQRLSGLG